MNGKIAVYPEMSRGVGSAGGGGCRQTPPWGGEGGWIGFGKNSEGGVGARPPLVSGHCLEILIVQPGAFFSGNKWMRS